MLSRLSISNYALISSLDITFPDGLVIITGETGAGKSILLGALSLLLGKRADVSVFSDSTRNCVVEAEFSDKDGQEYILRRVITPAGRSRSFLNDEPVTLSDLADISHKIIDIHGQHQHLLLGDPDFRLSVIDNFAGTAPLLEEFLFRKVILDGLSSRMRPWPAVIWSSVLFAVAHLNPWQALPALILGCFFGWVRLVTGSWWTTVGLHALNNAVTVAVAAVYGPDAALGGSPQTPAQDPVSMILCVLSVMVLAAGSVLFVKYGKSLNNHEKSDISH